MGGMKSVQGWAIRESKSPFRHWPTEMPFPVLFKHHVEAAEKAKQLMDASYFQGMVVAVELQELVAYPIGEGCPRGFGNEAQEKTRTSKQK